MEEIGFVNLLIVCVVAFGAPLALAMLPERMRLPAVVLEIVAGIVIGPSGLGLVEVDAAVEVLALVGLAFLLFIAGLEVDPKQLRGRPLQLAAAGFAASLVIGALAGVGFDAAGLVDSPLFVAVVLSATSLGVIVPVLKDAGESDSDFGQIVIVASSIADFGAIILLTLLFSGEASTGIDAKLVLLGGFVLVIVALAFAIRRAEASSRISKALLELQDTTAQIRVRGALVLMIGFAALAGELGLETILGAFAAGAILAIVDRDDAMNHPQFRHKLEAIGFGVFIPIFFVTSGLRFDLGALTSSGSTIAQVPLFLVALLAARGLPAILYRRVLGARRALIAGLLQATSLPFIVAATMIGAEIGLIDAASSAAFITAGLLSVLIFPITGLSLLKARAPEPKPTSAPA